MPRKIRPRYGIDPTQKVPEFSFSKSEIDRLVKVLAPVNGNPEEIIAQLNRCARDYLWRRIQHQQKPSRSEQNAALKEIRDLSAQLAEKLRGLDMDTQWEIMISLREFYTKSQTDPLSALADRLENFEDAADTLLKAGKQKTGPREPSWQQKAVIELSNIYENFTGRRFTHNPKAKAEYIGHPHSQAGHFIAEFFEIIDPNVTKRSLSTTMAKIVKSRRPTKKSTTS